MAMEPPFVTVRDKCQTCTDTHKNLKRMGARAAFLTWWLLTSVCGVTMGIQGTPMDKAAWRGAPSKAPKITHLT